MNNNAFRLVAPPHSPFDQDGSLNLAVVDQQAQHLERLGLDGVFVAGSTGECASLTLEERLDLAARWTEAAKGSSLEVIIQVGDNCQANAIQMARHAQRVSADAIAAYSPSYFKPADVDALIQFLEPIAAAAGDLPFYFYDIPPYTNVRLSMVELLEKGKQRMPNLIGIKYSNPDLFQMQECLQVQGGDFQVLSGSDETLLAVIALGAHGAIGSTYNLYPDLYRRIVTAFHSADFATARSLQLQAANLIRSMMRYGFMGACKEAMRMVGIDCGPVRPPLRNLDAAQRRSLREDLERSGMFELVGASHDAHGATDRHRVTAAPIAGGQTP